MTYRTFASMNIAVVGTGKTAGEYAARYALAGHEVLLTWRDGPKDGYASGNMLLDAMDNVTICPIENIAANADLIVMATQPRNVREAAYWLGDVRRKVIIDATANMHIKTGEEVNTMGAIMAITGSKDVVKVFSTRGYEQLLKPILRTEEVQLMLTGDSRKAKELTKILSKDLGVDKFFDFGGCETLPLFNELTKCWRGMAAKAGGHLTSEVLNPEESVR